MRLRVIFAQLGSVALLMAASSCSRTRPRPAGDETARAPQLMLAGKTQESQRRPLRPEETTPAIEQRAKEILDDHRDVPIGTEVPFEISGRPYVGRIEEHYHEPGGPERPWGRHRGVTVYRAE
jgi:hypothetical protein